MKAVVAIFAVYLSVDVLGLVLYVLSFRLPLGSEILFYRGLLLAGLVAAALLGLLLQARRWHPLATATVMGAVFTSLALNVCFLVLLPVTVDRSISVFLLARIEFRQPLTAAELEQLFEDEYLGEMQQIPRRVREQAISGNIAVAADGSIRLTGRGRAFNALARRASAWFGTDSRFVDDSAANRAPR